MLITTYVTTKFEKNTDNITPTPLLEGDLKLKHSTTDFQRVHKVGKYDEQLRIDFYYPNSRDVPELNLPNKIEPNLTPNRFSSAFEVNYRIAFKSGAYMVFSLMNTGVPSDINVSFTTSNTSTEFTSNLKIDGRTSLLHINTFSDSPVTTWDFVTSETEGKTLFGVIAQTPQGQFIETSGFLLDFSSLESFYGDVEKIVKDDEYGGFSGTGGYKGGSFDDSSDTIGIPNKPSLSVSSMGFVNVYRPTTGGLSGMVDELFPQVDVPDIPSGGEIADVVNSINSLIDTLANGIIQFGNKNLLDYVLDAHIIPVKPPTFGNSNIKVGYKTLSISAPRVGEDYVDFDCGTLQIPEYYANYIDYAYTKVKLYLPFVGFVPILPEYVFNGALRVVYRFNVLDGSFCAWVLSTSSKSKLQNSIIGSFSGNCCVHIPISATNYSNILSGMVNGVSNTINAIDNGNVSKTVDSAANTVASLKPEVNLSNGYNATSSYSGIRYPYLIIERQVSSFSQNYPRENGLPLNATYKLANLTGFTICNNINVTSLNCTEVEKEMIRGAFKEGVIL